MPSCRSRESQSQGGLAPEHLKVAKKCSKNPPARRAKPGAGSRRAPVVLVVYERAPTVVHARPQDFMSVVQRLTGMPPSSSGEGTGDHDEEPSLSLALGHGRMKPPVAPPVSPSGRGFPLCGSSAAETQFDA